MLQQVAEYPSSQTENLLNFRQRLCLREKAFRTPSEKRKDFEACMPRKLEQTLLRRLYLLQRLKKAFLELF